jgi:hypothetical protein
MSVTTANLIIKIRGLIKDLLRTDGREVFEFNTDEVFSLGENYITANSVAVYLNGTLLSEDDWSYNSTTNKVTIAPVTSGVSLVSEDNIIITYSYSAKYSDSEITSYIESNLVQFTKHRYAKTFYMNTSDQVVTSNGQNPTEAEGNIIALVTAIDIDPQNINVKIGTDFAITATEKKSKSELIDDVFTMFTRSFGIIEYLEEEKD